MYIYRCCTASSGRLLTSRRAGAVCERHSPNQDNSLLKSCLRAEKFDVTLPFLLQQAAWLYEQQLSQVKAQLRKASKPIASTAVSPTPGSISGSGVGACHALTRGGSGGNSRDIQAPSHC